jgi:hypothetical protein
MYAVDRKGCDIARGKFGSQADDFETAVNEQAAEGIAGGWEPDSQGIRMHTCTPSYGAGGCALTAR